MHYDRRGFQILRYVIETPTPDDLPIAEDTLISRYLIMEQFSADGISIPVIPEWTAHGCQQNEGPFMASGRLHRSIGMKWAH
jgi:hypothetical protein